MRVRDALGRELEIERPPVRIVSLVPSISETLVALGLASSLVGITDYCIHPAAELAAKARVGGTKNPRIRSVVELAPDLVIANKEENRRSSVEALVSAGIRVWVTYARSVADAVEEIETLGRITGRLEAAAAIAGDTRQALDDARRAGAPPVPVVALIWKKPYMAVGGDTFANDLLACAGGMNPFAAVQGRYPRIELEDLEQAAPEVILLPTEPYAFGEVDRRELLALRCPAARSGRIHIVEGELLSWYGPRMARALRVLSGLIRG